MINVGPERGSLTNIPTERASPKQVWQLCWDPIWRELTQDGKREGEGGLRRAMLCVCVVNE